MSDPWAEYRAACERTDRAFRAWKRDCDIGVVFFLGLAIMLGALYVFWFVRAAT